MALIKRITYEKIDLKKIMKEKGLSINHLSKLSGVPFSTLHYIINNKITMNEDNEKKIFAVIDNNK